MNNKRSVIVKNFSKVILFLIIGAFTLLISLDGQVKASSFPSGQLLTNQGKVNIGWKHLFEKENSYRTNESVKLASSVSVNDKTVANKVSDQKTDNIESNNFCRRHGKLLFILANVFGSVTIGVLIAYIRSRLLYP